MMADEKIKNSNELEFAVFCIENVAAKLGVDAERVYQAFTEKSDILSGYIVPEYEVLHTQSREYIVDDLLDMMKERNVDITHSNKNDQNEHSSAMTANPILLQKNIAVSSSVLQNSMDFHWMRRWIFSIALRFIS